MFLIFCGKHVRKNKGQNFVHCTKNIPFDALEKKYWICGINLIIPFFGEKKQKNDKNSLISQIMHSGTRWFFAFFC